MEYIVQVENIKCGGCANSIKQKLTEMEAVDNVSVDIEKGEVNCNINDQVKDTDLIKSEVTSKLQSMGYPEVGSVEGLKAAGAKAKSFVSCAVGRMSDQGDEPEDK